MGNTLLQSLLPTITLFSTFLSPSPSATLQAQVPSEKNEEVVHVVKKADTLATIAETYYGSTEYWTTVWKDNEWIENPHVIEKDWKLKIRSEMPEAPAVITNTLVAVPTVVVKTVENTQIVTTDVSVEPVSRPASPASLTDEQMTFLGMCESGMTATRNSGNGYYGAFQFSIPTWNSMNTGYARADLAPLEVQIDAVQRLLARSSIWTQFPGCAKKMSAAGLL